MSNKNETSLPCFFSVITANVRYDSRLSASEKIFYSEIAALTNAYGYCNASNNYFVQLYEVEKRTIQYWISRLIKFKYIITKYENNKRLIFLNFENQLNLYQQQKTNHLTDRKIIPDFLKNFYNDIK